MRNFTPQVETAEIADSDLDSISGGVGVAGGVSTGLLDVSTGFAVDGLEGLVGSTVSAVPLGTVTGLAGGAVGTVTGIAGL